MTFFGASTSNFISEVSPYNEVLANTFSDYHLVWSRTVCTKFAPCLFGSLLLGAALEASAIGRDMRELTSVIRIAHHGISISGEMGIKCSDNCSLWIVEIPWMMGLVS